MLKLSGLKSGVAAFSLAFVTTSAWAAPTVTGLVLVSEKRITRTVFEYTFRVSLQNDATALTNVVALAQSAGPGTSIIDDSATLPSLAANATQITADTIVLRHDRLKPFRKELIVWSVTGTPVRAGITLSGDPAATVQTAMPEYDAGHVVPESEISTDPDTGARIIRTVLYIVFHEGASVADVNDVLASIDGRILASMQGNGVVLVGIPDPGSLVALESIMDALRANPVVELVMHDSLPVTSALPQAQLSSNTLPRLDHHLAVRGAAAWNAGKAFRLSIFKPSLLIVDRFGDGVPGSAFGVDWKNPSAFKTGNLDSHGYHVAGIISATSALEEVTGMAPTGMGYQPYFPIHGYADDVIGELHIKYFIKYFPPGFIMRLAKNLHAIPGNIVVNTSLGAPCEFTNDKKAKDAAMVWLKLLRPATAQASSACALPSGLVPSELEKRFFHATAAGNVGQQGFSCTEDPALQKAKYTSHFAAASLLSPNILGAPPLLNTLAVENRMVAHPLSSPEKSIPICTSTGSFLEGHISAIGSRNDAQEPGVWSYQDAAPNSAIGKFGTSMATPQVAGLAIYLWSLRPDLTGPEVASAIVNHARPVTVCPPGDRSNTPIIDAYATILSADRSFDDAPARKAILDVNEDGVFDSADTSLFLKKMYLEPTAGTVADYSRYDLNGDGFTGGSGTEWVNLDMSYAPSDRTKSTYGIIAAADNGTPMSIDEKAVTDHQMLCYYVNSRLFPQDQLSDVSAQIISIRQQTGRNDIPSCNQISTCRLGQTLANVNVAPITPSVTFDGTGFDATRTSRPTWVKVSGVEYLFYAGTPFRNTDDLGLAKSTDGGQTWSKATDVPLIPRSSAPYWAKQRIWPVRVLHEDGQFKLWYAGNNTNLFTDSGNIHGFGYATSSDGISWTTTETPIRSESGSGQGARLLEVVKVGSRYLAYYDDSTPGQAPVTYVAKSADGQNFVGPDQQVPFGDEYRLMAATSLPGDECFLGLWQHRVTGAYVATTSSNGVDFKIVVSDVVVPSVFTPVDIAIEGQDVVFYGTKSEGNVNWSYGNTSIAIGRESFFINP